MYDNVFGNTIDYKLVQRSNIVSAGETIPVKYSNSSNDVISAFAFNMLAVN